MHIILDTEHPGEHIHPFSESVEFLRRVARGQEEQTLRLYRPAPNMAFGRRDKHNPSFEDAAEASRRLGFLPQVRPVGGHAAAYHAGSLVIDHFAPSADAISGNNRRFEFFAQFFVQVLSSLGFCAEVGELPGEYCPGEYSVFIHAGEGERLKIVGTAQRVVSGAWWFSTGIVVEDSAPLRKVTAEVYRHLAIPLEPNTVGALSDVIPQIKVEDVEDAVLEGYEKFWTESIIESRRL